MNSDYKMVPSSENGSGIPDYMCSSGRFNGSDELTDLVKRAPKTNKDRRLLMKAKERLSKPASFKADHPLEDLSEDYDDPIFHRNPYSHEI